MNINISDVCLKMYYILLDVNIGSLDREDLFSDVVNKYEVIENLNLALKEFNLGLMSKLELMEKIKAIEIENDIEGVFKPFVNSVSSVGEQFYYIFSEFNSFLEESFENERALNSEMLKSYENNKADYIKVIEICGGL